MATGGNSYVKTCRYQGFTVLLTSAACEWFLIFLLLVDAVLSYLLTKFASYWQLQAPCLLCSRLDHVLGGENSEFYNFLLCSNHRSEISSLISCQIHNKVAHGHEMCDDCLLSVTTKTEPNPKTQGVDLGGGGFQSPFLSKELFPGSKGSRTCTCRGMLWKLEQNTPKSILLKSPGRAVHNQSSFEPLSHVGYTEVELTSDSESDFPFSDDDGEGSVFRENIEASNDPIAKCFPSDLNPANPNSDSLNPVPFLLHPCMVPHISNHHGVKFLSSDAVNVHGMDEAEVSSSDGTQVLQNSASVESGLESMVGSNISEIEGESFVDKLKLQIEYDKKCMNALYKELEEERNAAAIAANQAMAMITKLQEEKAALHMDAFQYLRMMEEQAEYDGDALEKVNNLLAEKEKEIKDLEAELEWYKENLTDEPVVQSIHNEICELKGDNITVQNVSVPDITSTVEISSDAKITEVSKVSDEAVVVETSSIEFEEEKLYISQCLKSLEKKLHQICCTGISSNMPNGKSNQQGYSIVERPQLDGLIEKTDFSKQKNICTNGSVADQDDSVASDSDDCSLDKENILSTSIGPKCSMPRRKVDLVSLEKEISDLNDRLEALKADHDLLEHILNSLRNGSSGQQFIEDIAHQLHELRKIGIRLRW